MSEKEEYIVVEFSGLIDRLAIKEKLASTKFVVTIWLLFSLQLIY
jgi:hypothetical protein